MRTKGSPALLAIEAIGSRIIVIRGERVLLDADLAALYDVTTKALNLAVRRNAGRFPDDFAFQLTVAEVAHMKSQFVTSSPQAADPETDISNRSQIVTGSQKHRERIRDRPRFPRRFRGPHLANTGSDQHNELIRKYEAAG
jgi:hypothetical protein